ncbi:hypothetical protein B0H10DRAFT_2213704 [Mycena sp. CBHHK59/15]|nr:hypothetical protein B0H10DRAFT_2213704 [Mycena sp. CBHHK59/15]
MSSAGFTVSEVFLLTPHLLSLQAFLFAASALAVVFMVDRGLMPIVLYRPDCCHGITILTSNLRNVRSSPSSCSAQCAALDTPEQIHLMLDVVATHHVHLRLHLPAEHIVQAQHNGHGAAGFEPVVLATLDGLVEDGALHIHEFHGGTYTSHSSIKKGNQQSEILLGMVYDDAEVLYAKVRAAGPKMLYDALDVILGGLTRNHCRHWARPARRIQYHVLPLPRSGASTLQVSWKLARKLIQEGANSGLVIFEHRPNY